MSNEFLVSIIVPTKNREEYALNTAKQVLAINDHRIQLIIQDNSSYKRLETKLSSYLSDERLKYNYSSETLSFVDNFSKAVSIADGEYICIIGDDDGINPEIIELASWASKRKVKAIKPELQAIYFWPDAIDAKASLSKRNGVLTISKITADIRITNTKSELIKLLKNGCQRYLSLDLVKLYHGLVRKECLDEIFKRTGSYFGGLSPDIYSAVALSMIIPEVVSINYPITISGICNKSGSADSATGRHTGELKDAPHFIGHVNYQWSKEVPPFYSVETIWADSAIAAINDIGDTELLKSFNLEILAVYCIKKYNNHKELILSHFIQKNNLKSYKASLKKMKIRIVSVYTPLLDLIKKGRRKLINGKSELKSFNHINNICEAQEQFSIFLSSQNLNIEKIINEIESVISNKE